MTLVVPVVALGALWGLAVATQIGDAVELRNAYSLRDEVSWPCEAMVEALQVERSRSQEFLAVSPRDDTELRAQRARTDAAVNAFRRSASSYQGTGSNGVVTEERVTDMVAHFDTLAALRNQIDSGDISRSAALTGYSQIIGRAFGVLAAASASVM